MPSRDNRPSPGYYTSVVTRRNRQTRTHIEQFDGRWGNHAVYCLEHDRTFIVSSIPVRRQMAAHPREWCEGCCTAEPVNPPARGLLRHFGVEIECFHPEARSQSGGYMEPYSSYSVVAERMAKATGLNVTASWAGSSATGWRIKEDGSIRNDQGYYDGMEVVSPPLMGEDGLEEMHRVLGFLRKDGFKVNDSCGFHVHYDAADLNHRQAACFARTWNNNQDLIDWLVEADRRDSDGGGGGYCHRMPESVLANIERATNKSMVARRSADRYYAVNLRSLMDHGTIEVRQHHGTVNGFAAESWVRFGIALIDNICAKGEAIGKVVGLRTLMNSLPVSTEAKAFLLGNALAQGAPIEAVAA